MTEYIIREDLPKFRRLMILDMKLIVPKPLTKEERQERADLTIEFNSKYPQWRDHPINFLTGEIQLRVIPEEGSFGNEV